MLVEKTLKEITLLALITILSTFIIWIPHIFKFSNFYNLDFQGGFENIYRNYDGIEYVIIAKTFYNPQLISQLPQSLPDIYYAAHFPGYSLLILIFAPILGFLKSMLLISLLSTITAVVSFYYFVKDFKLTSNPFLLSLFFLFLPARWIIQRSIGSAEPLFITFVILTLYFFLKFEYHQKFLFIMLTGLFGFLAQLTRPPGILIFIALSIYIFWKELIKQNNFKQNLKLIIKNYFPLLLIPVGLLFIFVLFYFVYNDFFAYFHSGDNIHLTFPPFQVFDKNQYWVGEIWLEDIIFVLLLGFYGGILLIKGNYKPLGFFTLTYLLATTLVSHRDISRYALPIFPFILIAFQRVITSKEFKIALAIIIPALYLYTQNFLINNTAPFPNLEYFD